MTKRHGLEALKERSAAALRQKDLVGLAVRLARTETPSQALKIASSHGWPQRLAKSVQSLAMLRRDFGPEALHSFISTFEHARSLLGETEHALETNMNRERVLRSISHLVEPAAKLRLLIKHGLIDDARAFVEELLFEEEVSFWFCTNSASYATSLLPDSAATKRDGSNEIRIRFDKKGVKTPDATSHPVGPGLEEKNTVIVLVSDLVKALQWSDAEARSFVRRALSYVARRPLVYRHHDCINGTEAARNAFLEADDDIGRAVDLVVLRTRFRDGEAYGLASYYPIDLSDFGVFERGSEKAISRMLNWAVDRFGELGLTMEQIRSEFLWWLENRPGTWPGWIHCFASAKCFEGEDVEARRKALHSYLPQLWEMVNRGSRHESCNLSHVKLLSSVGLYRRSSEGKEGDEAFFRAALQKFLSEGKAGRVFQALLELGDVAGLNPSASWEENGGKTAAIECMNRLSPDAFKAAFDEGNFGIAAALAKQFRCFPHGVADRKLEAIQLAEDLEQPIELVSSFNVEAMLQ